MFIGFSNCFIQTVLTQENIVKITRSYEMISIYYWDIGIDGNKYIETIELDYHTEEKAVEIWNEFFSALRNHEEIYYFDSDD